jgi:hypothetical protein
MLVDVLYIYVIQRSGIKEIFDMRKIISILLVLSVCFVMYAETGVGSTTLNLNLLATVHGKLYHGFTEDDNTSANAVKNELSGSGTGNRSVGINLESNASQPIGYYNLYTTGNSQIKVEFTTSPMSMEVGATWYYVPYQLTYAASHGNSRVIVEGTSIGTAAVATTVNPDSSTPIIVLKTTSNGLRWQTISLAAKFAGSLNESFGLPESVGAGYTGTIVANVSVYN